MLSIALDLATGLGADEFTSAAESSVNGAPSCIEVDGLGGALHLVAAHAGLDFAGGVAFVEGSALTSGSASSFS
jgi:hypothetical protein